MKNFKRGFTLLEILITIGIMGILLVIALPSLGALRNTQTLKSASYNVISLIDKARSQATSSLNSSEYGVHITSTSITLFKGTTYSPSDTTNEVVSIDSPASISSINLSGGAVDLYFDRLSGAPNKTGTLTVSVANLSKTITISTTGGISVN